MSEELILDWLAASWSWFENNAATLAQVFAVLITAAATYALWRATRILAIETARLAKMTAQPFVICWLESSGASPTALNLTLRNTGNATAFDIKLRLSPALPKPNGDPSDNPDEKTFETSLLPPGHLLSVQGVIGANLGDQVFSAHLSWACRPGSIERENLDYSFAPKDGFRGGWNTKGTHQIAEELEKIGQLLGRR